MSTVFFRAIHRDERSEAWAFLLTEQHRVQHVEPVERHARLAVLGLLLLIEERLAAADLIDDVLDRAGLCIGRQLRQRIAQIGQRRAFAVAGLAELSCSAATKSRK